MLLIIHLFHTNIQILTKSFTKTNPRILCLVSTAPQYHSRTQAVKQKWGKRCNILVFVSLKADPDLPTIDMECNDYNDKNMCLNNKGIIYAVNHYKGYFDWVFKAEDNTYLIYDNLKYFLQYYDPNDPIVFGSPLALAGDPNTTFLSSGNHLHILYSFHTLITYTPLRRFINRYVL